MRTLPVRTLDGAWWESVCSTCSGTIFSVLSFSGLTEKLSPWYSSDKLPSISHSSNIHWALALSRLSDTAESDTVPAGKELMGQWESRQLTKLPSLYSPLLSPDSRQQAQHVAWPGNVLLYCLALFVLVISSLKMALPFYPSLYKSCLYQPNLNASSPGKPSLILSTQKSHVIPLILSCGSSPALVCVRAPGGLGALPVFPV